MNTRDIFTFCFTSFVWTVFMLFNNYNDLTWRLCIFFIITGLLFGLLLTWSLKRQRKEGMRKLLALNDFDIEENVLQKDWMNYFRSQGMIADIGFGFLLEDRLIFIQQKSEELLTILYSDVTQVSDFKFLGFFGAGLKITLKSGKTERFTLDKKSDFYQTLIKYIAKK